MRLAANASIFIRFLYLDLFDAPTMGARKAVGSKLSGGGFGGSRIATLLPISGDQRIESKESVPPNQNCHD